MENKCQQGLVLYTGEDAPEVYCSYKWIRERGRASAYSDGGEPNISMRATGRILTVPKDDVEQTMAPHPTHVQRLPERQAKHGRIEHEDRAPRRRNVCAVSQSSAPSRYNQ